MEIQLMEERHERWNAVRDYAGGCGWSSGKILAEDMENHRFTDWERVAVLLDDDKICGYCTIIKEEAIPGMPYTPFVGTLFVDEAYRGRRLGEELIAVSMKYLKSEGFERTYLITDHDNLYEKYGFQIVDRRMAPWGREEKVYMKENA